MKALAPIAALVAAALSAHASPAAAAPSITGGWARATLPGQSSAAAYATLRSDAGDTLLGVQSEQAGAAMLHRSTRTGQISGMEDVDSLPLPAGENVTLAPGGLHIMVMNLRRPLEAGGTLRLIFRFARGGEVQAAFPVRPAGAAAP